MYIQLFKLERGLLLEKPPFTSKKVEKPVGHRRKGINGRTKTETIATNLRLTENSVSTHHRIELQLNLNVQN